MEQETGDEESNIAALRLESELREEEMEKLLEGKGENGLNFPSIAMTTSNRRGVQVRFVQINAHHAHVRASADLARNFAEAELGIALIQGPWLSNGQVIWDLPAETTR